MHLTQSDYWHSGVLVLVRCMLTFLLSLATNRSPAKVKSQERRRVAMEPTVNTASSIRVVCENGHKSTGQG